MTTAGRPTWSPAIGGSSMRERGIVLGTVSSKDQALERKLKVRHAATMPLVGEVGTEHNATTPKTSRKRDIRTKRRKTGGLLSQQVEQHVESDNDNDVESTHVEEDLDSKDDTQGKTLTEQQSQDTKNNIHDDTETDVDDQDSQISGDVTDDDNEEVQNDEYEEEEDEEEAELMRELERVREERRQQRLQEEQQRIDEERSAAERAAMSGNPLLYSQAGSEFGDTDSMVSGMSRKRRWDDDVVFKNQATSDVFGTERNKPRFINDPLRSDMCRRFLKRYIQ